MTSDEVDLYYVDHRTFHSHVSVDTLNSPELRLRTHSDSSRHVKCFQTTITPSSAPPLIRVLTVESNIVPLHSISNYFEDSLERGLAPFCASAITHIEDH